MGMKDPYENIWKDISNALSTYSNMILWIAERTLSVKDYKEFIDTFTKKDNNNNDELIEFMRHKGR